MPAPGTEVSLAQLTLARNATPSLPIAAEVSIDRAFDPSIPEIEADQTKIMQILLITVIIIRYICVNNCITLLTINFDSKFSCHKIHEYLRFSLEENIKPSF